MNPWTWPPDAPETEFVPPPPLGPTPGTVLQRVRTQDGAQFSFSSTIPFDTTVPQNNEGTAYTGLNTTIIPQAAGSKLSIDLVIAVSSAGVTGMTVAIFRDADPNAIATGFTSIESASRMRTIALSVTVTAGSTSPILFTLRVGSGGQGGFLHSNGTPNLWGGTCFGSLTVTEIAT